MNNKAVSTVLVLLVIVIIAIIGAAAAFSLNAAPQPSTDDVTVFIDGKQQAWNETVAAPIGWPDNVSTLKMYTKNFTVANNSNQTFVVYLITSEPAGCKHTWIYNGTAVGPKQYAAADLILTTEATITTGEYTWKLKTSNSTIPLTPTPTPTANPSATPTVTRGNLTITTAGTGVQTIKVTNVNQGGSIILTPTFFPYTFQYSTGDTFTLEVTALPGYTFNAWTFSDGAFPQSVSMFQFTLSSAINITVTANFLLQSATPTPTASAGVNA